MVTDANITEKTEVEAQYTIQFEYNNVKHNVHMTFYYTKCSIWIQGSSTKINNITIAQFFATHYLEKLAHMIVKNINLESIKTELKQRLVSFIENEEGVSGS